MLVPSDETPDAISALRSAISAGCTVRGAVAFVTRGGVDLLADVLRETSVASLEVTARAADITDPDALCALRDELGAQVSVVIGKPARAFHPKLWLITRTDKLVVISGSGNLTGKGLTTNDEQFEITECALDSRDAQHQEDRLGYLTRNAEPLNVIEGKAIWREWMDVRKRQAIHRRELARIEKNFLSREPVRVDDRTSLIADLQAIYEATVAADLPRRDGKHYLPTRMLASINLARTGKRDPVKVVDRMVAKETTGLNILVQASLIELTVEWLVIDSSKSYHDLFAPTTVDTARSRIKQFQDDGHDIPDPGDEPAVAEDVMTNEQIHAFLTGILAKHPSGFALPRLHKAQATLVAVDDLNVTVRRDSGTDAVIAIKLIRARLTQLAANKRFRVSELAESPSDRFNSAFGPLLAALPSVAFDDSDQRLYYRKAA